MVNYSDLERKIKSSLDADVAVGGEAVASPAFRSNVFQGQLVKFKEEYTKEELKDHLNDLAVQAFIFAQAYAEMIGVDLNDLARDELTELEIATGKACNAITHKQHKGGDEKCYELKQKELVSRGRDFLRAANSYINAKIVEYELETTVEEHFNEGYANVIRGKGKDKDVQKSRGSISSEINSNHYVGIPTAAIKGNCIGVAYQMEKSTKFPEIVEVPTIFVASRFEPGGNIPKNTVALIAEQGGRTCHVTVLAREYGLPAAYGVGEISNIHSGDILCLEGVERAHIFRLATLIDGEYKLTQEAERFYNSGDKSVTDALERITSIKKKDGAI